MGKDITTTQILSTCAHCGETVEYHRAGWFSREERNHVAGWFRDCSDGQAHTVDLSHAFSHMTVEG